MTRNVPARLHVLLARDTAAAVVIRRGPSRYTALVGWDRKNDTFKLGQWLHGRIYERRSDLSPDGKYLIYFAMNGRWASSVKGAWSAILRAPYLKAISLFPKGDCWHGGGLFLSETEYWLNDSYGHEVLEEDRRLKRAVAYPWHEQYGGECPSVYYIRLQRDGWKMRHTVPHGKSGTISVFEKRIGDHWALRKLAHATLERSVGRGAYFDTHELVNKRTGEAIVKDRWEWADVDGSRLVWAENGCLYAGRIESKGLCGEKALFDFTPMKFEKLTAPY
jgi:hypothetical protein